MFRERIVIRSGRFTLLFSVLATVASFATPGMVLVSIWVASTASATGSPRPQREIRLSPGVACNAPAHHITRVHFSPTQNLLAVVVRDVRRNGTWLPGWHLCLVSRDGTLVRQLTYDQQVDYEVGENDRQRMIFWSPGSDYAAVTELGGLNLVRIGDGKSCIVPLDPGIAAFAAVGFVKGPLFVMNRNHELGPSLDFYGPDCSLQESVPAPSSGRGKVLPAGDALAFGSPYGVLLSDARGQNTRTVKFDWLVAARLWGGDNAQGFFAESGRVFCPDRYDNRCFNVLSGQAIGKPPTRKLGNLFDASATGSRTLWRSTPEFRAIDKVTGILWALVGEFPLSDLVVSWHVWDYQDGSEILSLPPTPSAADGVVALAPGGDCLAMAVKDSVLIFELPLK